MVGINLFFDSILPNDLRGVTRKFAIKGYLITSDFIFKLESFEPVIFSRRRKPSFLVFKQSAVPGVAQNVSNLQCYQLTLAPLRYLDISYDIHDCSPCY